MKQRIGLAMIVSLGCGCSGNQTCHIAATSLGDTTHPASHGSPLAALDEACGATGALVSDATARIVREPYLQQLTTSSVIVGWLSTIGSDEWVEVTRPDGTTVTNVKPSVERRAAEKQMWARIGGLEPDTIYCYALTSGGKPLSMRTGFRTAPVSGPIRFVAFGDSGSGASDPFALLEQMRNVRYDLMIHTGDLAYDGAEFEDTAFAVYAELFRHIPFFPCPGNETFPGAGFREVFNLPGRETWYSFDYGSVHFAALDTEASYATQAAWLASDLAATKAPWKVVYMHRPPYSSGELGSNEKLRAAIGPVVEKYGVQLVLAGHEHDYERILPQHGIQYIVTGGGGSGTRPVGHSAFTAFSADVVHFVYVEVNAEKMVVHAIDGTGMEFDSVVIPRT